MVEISIEFPAGMVFDEHIFAKIKEACAPLTSSITSKSTFKIVADGNRFFTIQLELDHLVMGREHVVQLVDTVHKIRDLGFYFVKGTIDGTHETIEVY